MNKYVCIFGPPRSGTSWVGQIFNSSPDTFYLYQPFYYLRNKTIVDKKFLQKNLDMLVKKQAFFKGSFIPSDPSHLQATNDSLNYLSFYKTKTHKHVVIKNVRYHHLIEDLIQIKDAKIIGLIRSPLATINSWLNSPKEFNVGLDPLKEWNEAATKNSNKHCYEYAGFLNWSRIAQNYIKLEELYPNNFKLIRYQDLLGETQDHIIKMLEFCGVSFTESTSQFLLDSRSKEGGTYSVFRENKLKDNAWEKELNPQIAKEIANLTLNIKGLERFLKD